MPLGLNKLQRTARAGTVPSFIICGASPIFVPLLASAGLADLSFALHQALWLFAPLNLALLVRNYRFHRNRGPAVAGVLGTISIWVHLTGQNLGLNILPLIWAGIALLLAGSYMDAAAQKQFRLRLLTESGIEEYWRAVWNGEHPGLRRGPPLLSNAAERSPLQTVQRAVRRAWLDCGEAGRQKPLRLHGFSRRRLTGLARPSFVTESVAMGCLNDLPYRIQLALGPRAVHHK